MLQHLANDIAQRPLGQPAAPQVATSSILSQLFNQVFEVVIADTPELIAAAHRLRFQVFCVENQGYEDPSCHPDGMEKDKYDAHASQALLYYKPLNKAIGTVRNIYANPLDLSNSFPLQKLVSSPLLHDLAVVKVSCELSRLSISSEFMKHAKTHLLTMPNPLGPNAVSDDLIAKRLVISMAPYGLVRGCFAMAKQHGVDNGFGIMESLHLTKLINAGFQHRVLGPDIDYHGMRTPFSFNVSDTLNTRPSRAELKNIVCDLGAVKTVVKECRLPPLTNYYFDA